LLFRARDHLSEIEARLLNLNGKKDIEASQWFRKRPPELVAVFRQPLLPGAGRSTTSYRTSSRKDKQEILERSILAGLEKVSTSSRRAIGSLRLTKRDGAEDKGLVVMNASRGLIRGRWRPSDQLGEGDGKAKGKSRDERDDRQGADAARGGKPGTQELRRYERSRRQPAEAAGPSYLDWLIEMPGLPA